MRAQLRCLIAANPDTLMREALGLSGLVVAILAGLFLPVFA